MTKIGKRSYRSAGHVWPAGILVLGTAVAVLMATQSTAGAAVAPVNLGTAGSFGVLAGTTVTNTGPSFIGGDLGVSPGTAVTGFPPGIVTGVTHAADGVAAGAQSDLTTAYIDAMGRSPSASVGTIGAGQTLTPGVYNATSSLFVNGALTLDAQGNPDAVFIFQAGSTLITGTGTNVILTNGAQACNVFWQVGSSATLAPGSTFQGSILALTSISVQTGDTIVGRALARNGAVTLDDDTITVPTCASPTPTPTPTTPTPTPTTPTPTPTPTTPTPTPTPTTPTPTPTHTRTPTPTPTPTHTRTPTPTPTPTHTRTPTPTPTPTHTRTPTPAPTPTSPSPSPTTTKHRHHRHHRPAPRPKPVHRTFPVTG
jgi:hypothetical protein